MAQRHPELLPESPERGESLLESSAGSPTKSFRGLV